MPRWVGAVLLTALGLSLGGNGVLFFRLRAARHEIKRQTIMCRDSENLAYSPGSLLVVDGQLMRCKVSGVWIDTDESGKPLPRTHGPSTGRGSSQ